ncbi:MAG: metallophosphoesterase family protein [Planctomycetota bacterium]|jgi:3',5'-cyclic AMP phosphodiesterase CpdA
MKRIAWLTDLHLEFIEPDELHAFVGHLIHSMPDIVLVGGDTGTADKLASFFQFLEMRLERPIYFVLGNHDYYHGSITQVRAIAEKLSKSAQWLYWLPIQGVVPISVTTGLIGHGSWADGRLGNGNASQVELNDYYMIKELKGLSPQRRFIQLARLGDQAAEYFGKLLPKACAQFSSIILLTHVPPFRDACWHEGEISNDEYLPHFACKAVGDVLVSVMKKYPKCKLTVLCGHTHSKGEVNILPNLYVKTGSAQYGRPCLQEILIIE